MMKRILILVLLTLLMVVSVDAMDRMPTEVIAVKKSDEAVIAWRNPDCDMTFIKLYQVKSGIKTLIEDSFELAANEINEYEFSYADADEYLINFRCGDGSDRYYTVNKFNDVTNTDRFIRDWEVDYKEVAGVRVGLDRHDKKSGKSSLCIVSDTLKYDTVSVSQCVCDIIDKESQYRIGFWIKALSADSIRVKLSYNKYTDKITFIPDVKDSIGEWKYITYTFSGEYAGYVSFDASTNAHEVRIDDVTLFKLENGKEYGVNLLSNSAFTLSDNIINNKVENLSGIKKDNKVILSWTLPESVDNDRVRIYNGDMVVSEVMTDVNTVRIDFRECISDTYTVVVVDKKGNLSEGVSVVPDEEKKPIPYREYFNNASTIDSITKVSFNGNYSVSDGMLYISKSKGLHLLPASLSDEFTYKVDLKLDTSKNTKNLGVVFGYDESTARYGVVFFNGSTMTISKSDVSNIGTAVETVATVNCDNDILSLDEINKIKIVQTSDLFEVSVDDVILYKGDSLNLNGGFGLSTVGLLGIYVDNVEIRSPEPRDFAIYDDDFLRTGELGFVNKQRPASELNIAGNSLRYKENGGNSLWVLENGEELEDFVFDFDYTFKAYKYNSSNYCGIAFGYDEAGTVYRIGLRNEGKIFLSKNDVINDTGLASYAEYPMDFQKDKTYRMRVTVKDKRLKLYRDGELVMEYSGENFDYAGGSFGLIANGGGAEFKNILITPYHEEPMKMGKNDYSQDFDGMNVLTSDIVKLSGNVNVSESDSGMNINSMSGNAVYSIDNLLDKKTFSYTAQFSLVEGENQNSGFGLVFRSEDNNYRIMLQKDGKIIFSKYDESDVSEVLASVESGLDFTENTTLKLLGMDNSLYVYVNNKLYIKADMNNETEGFGFEMSETQITLNSLSVKDVSMADYAAVDGYYAVIENIETEDNMVTFDVLAGLGIDGAYLIGTVYDGNMLKEVKIINPVNISTDNEEKFTFTFNETVGGDTINIMLFKDLDKFTPMAKALKK